MAKRGISIWLDKGRRAVLEKVIKDYDKSKLGTPQEKYLFENIREQIVGKYQPEFEQDDNNNGGVREEPGKS